MATSEHVIMQNEALVALALIAALELGKYPSDKLFCLSIFICLKGSSTSGVEVIFEASICLYLYFSMGKIT